MDARKMSPKDLSTQYNTISATFSVQTAEGNASDSADEYFTFFPEDLSGKFVLDLGCGPADYDYNVFYKRGAIVTGIDSSSEILKQAKKNNEGRSFTFIEARFDQSLPFENHTFDYVVSKWALQTAPSIDPIFEEAARVLKQEGEIIYLTVHPLRQHYEKNKPNKDYFKQEIVTSKIFDGKIEVKEPSHTVQEYISDTFLRRFSLLAFKEGRDKASEQLNGDSYPTYLIMRGGKK